MNGAPDGSPGDDRTFADDPSSPLYAWQFRDHLPNSTAVGSLVRLALELGDRRLVGGAAHVANALLRRGAWPRAKAAGLRWPESNAERDAFCRGGGAYPALCDRPEPNMKQAYRSVS